MINPDKAEPHSLNVKDSKPASELIYSSAT